MDSSSMMKLWRQLQSLAKLFRFVELCILLSFLFWLSTNLPFAIRISGEYFRKFLSLIFCPISIFLVGNAIVLTLLTKSGLFTGDCSSLVDNAVAELYDEFRSDDIPVSLKDEVVFQDKEIIICEENAKPIPIPKAVVVVDDNENKPAEDAVVPDELNAIYKRCQSDKWKVESVKEKLRRSETDICWRSLTGGGDASAADEGMSSDEFRRTIEAFIAKQVSFHREERLSVVLHGQA